MKSILTLCQRNRIREDLIRIYSILVKLKKRGAIEKNEFEDTRRWMVDAQSALDKPKCPFRVFCPSYWLTKFRRD